MAAEEDLFSRWEGEVSSIQLLHSQTKDEGQPHLPHAMSLWEAGGATSQGPLIHWVMASDASSSVVPGKLKTTLVTPWGSEEKKVVTRLTKASLALVNNCGTVFILQE